MRSVRFFDNPAAAVHRHDLVPFREYEKTLGRAKKNAAVLTALKAAKQSFEKAAKRGEETALPARLTKQQQAAAAKAAAAAEDGVASFRSSLPERTDLASTAVPRAGAHHINLCLFVRNEGFTRFPPHRSALRDPS